MKTEETQSSFSVICRGPSPSAPAPSWGLETQRPPEERKPGGRPELESRVRLPSRHWHRASSGEFCCERHTVVRTVAKTSHCHMELSSSLLVDRKRPLQRCPCPNPQNSTRQKGICWLEGSWGETSTLVCSSGPAATGRRQEGQSQREGAEVRERRHFAALKMESG